MLLQVAVNGKILYNFCGAPQLSAGMTFARRVKFWEIDPRSDALRDLYAILPLYSAFNQLTPNPVTQHEKARLVLNLLLEAVFLRSFPSFMRRPRDATSSFSSKFG